MQPPKRKKRRRKDDAAAEDEGLAASQELDEINADYGEDNPDVLAPEDRNAVGTIGKQKKLEARDHVLITAGPPEYISNPQAWHGGRLDNDRFGLDVKSTCTRGAFVKPWLRVPKGGCLAKTRRDTTDKLPMRILLFLWMVCVFAGAFGWLEGDLALLVVGGKDFVGNVCGKSSYTAAPPDALVADLDIDWSERKYLWYPIDPVTLGDGLHQVTQYGVCVTECPRFDATLTAYQSFKLGVPQYMWSHDISSNDANCAQRGVCRVRNHCSKNNAVGCVRTFRVLYPTTLLHHQCVPDVYSNGSTERVTPDVASLMHQLSGDVTFHHDWWFSVTADCYVARYIILAGSLITFVFGELYLMLMKWSPLAVAWGSVVLLVASSIATALMLLDHQSMLRTTQDEKYLMRKRYEGQFSTFAYVLVVVGVLNTVVCIMLRRKVVIASQLMVEANRVLKESPGISVIAPIVWFLQALTLSLASVTVMFIGTIGWDDDANSSETYTNISPFASLYHILPQTHVLHVARAPFQVLMVVVAMWTLGFLNTVGYSFTTFISCMWFFSKPGEQKEPPQDGVWIAAGCVAKHYGSCAGGAVILTLFESIRGYLEKIQSLLRKILEQLPKSLFMFTCIIHYVLMLFDRGLKLVRRDAFVIQCIEGSDFLHAARRAGRLYESYKNQIHMIAEVSENVVLFGRIGIMSLTLATTTYLLLLTPMGDGIDNPIIIIIFLSANAFFVATLFAQITNATMDAFLMCYCYDMDVNDGSIRRPFFTHLSLKLLIDQHASLKNEYRNIYAGNDFTVGNLKHQILDAKQRVEETLKDAEKTTKATAKTLHRTANTLADEAGNAAKKSAEMSRKATKQTLKAAQDAANKVETGAKSGASTISRSTKKGLLSKATGALSAEIEKTHAAAHKGAGGNKRAKTRTHDSPGQAPRSPSLHRAASVASMGGMSRRSNP
eukprot:TRINITY_DN50613_c0_g1_i1.p1 TRINITY_DN50613_c0_g1~~TRINITY_DN50613_c0_g1_i1.p1  ORF type:complete len:947 (+),score=391.82 TRINITY_DN50613_c0_g1_i1:41-2881(+)